MGKAKSINHPVQEMLLLLFRKNHFMKTINLRIFCSPENHVRSPANSPPNSRLAKSPQNTVAIWKSQSRWQYRWWWWLWQLTYDSLSTMTRFPWTNDDNDIDDGDDELVKVDMIMTRSPSTTSQLLKRRPTEPTRRQRRPSLMSTRFPSS